MVPVCSETLKLVCFQFKICCVPQANRDTGITNKIRVNLSLHYKPALCPGG